MSGSYGPICVIQCVSGSLIQSRKWIGKLQEPNLYLTKLEVLDEKNSQILCLFRSAVFAGAVMDHR